MTAKPEAPAPEPQCEHGECHLLVPYRGCQHKATAAPSQPVYSEEEARKRGGGMIRCFAGNYSCDWEASKGSKYCHHHEYLEQSAPSQPAREREALWACADGIIRGCCLSAVVHDDLIELLKPFFEIFAAQQSAAKDAENAELRQQLDIWESNEPCPECGEAHVCGVQAQLSAVCHECGCEQQAREAAERERDSLREAVQQAHEALRTKILPNKAFKILDAALKAGKDGQQ